MTDIDSATPSQPALVAYLEQLLERARVGEVQFFMGAAALTPAGNPQGLDVEAFSALGARVERWAPAARMAAYATTLEGVQSACKELDVQMAPHRPRVLG